MPRLLHVDDDRVNSLLFAEFCRPARGVEVKTARAAVEALELVRRWTPEWLVVGLRLPDLDGYRVLHALRSCLETRPGACLCTADDALVVDGPARAAGVDGGWSEPVDLNTVPALLARQGGVAA